MGEALIVRRGGGVKVAEGFPKELAAGTVVEIPDLIGCNGFVLFVQGTGTIGGNSPGHLASAYYDGEQMIVCTISSTSTSTSIKASKYYRGDFDSLTGTITFTDVGFSSDCAVQCIYW